MTFPVETLTLFGDATAASSAMRSFIAPAVNTICVLASLACVFFLVNGGIRYMTASGKPEQLESAKRLLKNALIGLVLVIAAATLTAILAHAYASSGQTPHDKLPTLQPIEPQKTSGGLVDVLINAVVGLLRNIIQSIGEPFVKALSYFTNSTPLMGDNSSVFNIWLAIVGIADVLMVLVIALLGFHVMSFDTFGFDELEIKHLLPQIALIFLLINTSIFAIDAVISLSNGMIHALQSGFPSSSIWQTLTDITKKSDDMGLAGLLVMIAFLVLSVMLLVYYVGRIITLYIGAVLSPLVLLLWLLPAFKDFALTALKTYLTTIFVLFVHVVILLLASSIFTGMLGGNNSGQPNAIMALVVGLATVLALIKTQGVMKELSYAASAPRAAREMSSQFTRGVSTIYRSTRSMSKTTKNTYAKASNKVNNIRTSNAANSRPAQKILSPKSPNSPPSPSGLKTGQTAKADRVPKK
ncbi:MAG TPA: pilin [Candidatus Saccharimonadales bacterium]|nr:pilin [Candidatus Saccharimonadales bacterium]